MKSPFRKSIIREHFKIRVITLESHYDLEEMKTYLLRKDGDNATLEEIPEDGPKNDLTEEDESLHLEISDDDQGEHEEPPTLLPTATLDDDEEALLEEFEDADDELDENVIEDDDYEAFDDSLIDPDWKNYEEVAISSTSSEDDTPPENEDIGMVDKGTDIKLVDYSISGDEADGDAVAETSEDEILEVTISDGAIGIEDEEDDDTDFDDFVNYSDLDLPINEVLSYSPVSELGPASSPIRNRDLLTPPSQPSSAPSSPPSAPSTPSTLGPRTPILHSKISSTPCEPGSPATRYGSSPLGRPAAPRQSENDPDVQVSMRGALTHRLNKLAVENKTRNPVPDNIKVALAENNVDRGIKFTLSHLMNDQMLLDNYLLKKNKGPIDRKKGVTINWQCVSQNCYFRATTVDADIEKTNGNHNHDPNVELFFKREGRLKLKEAVAASDAPLASVVMNVIGTSDDAYLTAHGSNEAMKQCARRFKQSQFPDLGKQLAIKVNLRLFFVIYSILILLASNICLVYTFAQYTCT